MLQKVAGWYLPDEQLDWSRLEWREGDVENLASLMEAMEGCNLVYHCAAMVSFNPAKKRRMILSNVQGTANMVDAALNLGITRFCHTSSIAALGSAMDDEIIDEHTPRNPNARYSGYSISKLYSELEVWRGIHMGLQAVIVNPAIILGPGDWNQGSARFIKTLDEGLSFYTSGLGSFVDVRDVVEVMIRLSESEISGERFCLSPHSVSYRDFFREISRLLGKKEPSIAAQQWQMQVMAGLMRFFSLITGKEPAITKETAASAFNRKQYSSAKISQTMEIQFRSMEDSLRYCVDAYLKEKKEK